MKLLETITLTNILKLFSTFSPILIIFLIILYSLFSNNLVSSIFLLFGSTIVIFACFILKKILKIEQNKHASNICNLLPAPFFTLYGRKHDVHVIYSEPSTNISLIAYIFMFVTYPMIENKNFNYSLFIILLFMLLINCIIEMHMLCSSLIGIILGLLLGITIGLMYYIFLNNMQGEKKTLTYGKEYSKNDTESKDNNSNCYLANSTTFICNSY